MSNNMNIVDRVVERLKKQPVGDLITDEDLHDICKVAIERAFFEKQKKKEGSGYSEKWVETEPKIVELMRDLLHEEARKQVQTFIAANADRLMDQWKEIIDDGLLGYVERLQEEKIRAQIRDALWPMVQQLNQERTRHGLMPIAF